MTGFVQLVVVQFNETEDGFFGRAELHESHPTIFGEETEIVDTTVLKEEVAKVVLSRRFRNVGEMESTDRREDILEVFRARFLKPM